MMSAQKQYPPILQTIEIDPTNHSFLPYISFVYTPQINGLYKRKRPFRSKKEPLKKQESKKKEARDMSSNCKANHTYYLLLITYYLRKKQENALHWKD
ncbi:MAG: hypothetical protein II449_00765 [Prevotella sp.]|nr:hypothetical protein [Prevotella sp.]